MFSYIPEFFSEIIFMVWNFNSNSSFVISKDLSFLDESTCNAKKELVRTAKTYGPSEFPSLK